MDGVACCEIIKLDLEGVILKFKHLPEVVPKARPRFRRNGQTYTPAKTKNFELLLRSLVVQAGPVQMFKEPLEVNFNFHIKKPKSVRLKHPSVKPDFDNYIKAVCDALNNLVWLDDGQIVRGTFNLSYSESNTIEVHVFKI